MTTSIKTCFQSRREGGYIMEADYSQLEVIVLAHLCKDKQLIKDILSGVDMHTVRASELFGVSESLVTPQQRKLAKALSFQLQYGSGAKNMAEKNNIDISIAKKFISNYYSRYPKLKAWQSELYHNVESSRKLVSKQTKKGFPVHSGWYSSETGRKYVFYTSDAPEFLDTPTSFKPTEVKNYMVQGTATGDIVPMMLGEVYRWLLEKDDDRVLLVNTVHDSIILDVSLPSKETYEFGKQLKELMESAPNIYQERFGVEFTLPMKVGVTYGKDWKSQDIEVK